jgi:hypothetical protein
MALVFPRRPTRTVVTRITSTLEVLPLKSVLAACVFAALTIGAIVFEIALAAGMPWGDFAWGGNYPGVLPTELRVASVVQAFLLFAIVMVVLIRAGLILPVWHPISKKLVWAVVVYCALGVIANAITPSFWERTIWLPVLTICFSSSLVVAKGR